MIVLRLRAWLVRLRRDLRGVAMTEFAFAAPLLLVLGMCGIEMANYALVRMRISQLTLNMADNVSRVGLDTGLAVFQLTEGDVNDTVVGASVSGGKLDLFTHGRVVISSLEMNADGGQWIHWQRCKGVKAFVSAYGTEGTGATGTAFTGMGPANARVTSPSTSTAVMYVEMNYDYQPLFAFLWSNAPTGKFLGSVFNNSLRSIRYGNAFMVRDNRDLRRIYNPNNPLTGQPASPASCATYSAT